MNDNSDALISLLDELAEHFRKYGQLRFADAVGRAVAGEPGQLPRRVLALFRYGMGGLLDCPLYSDGKVDRAATDRLYQLADQVYKAAAAMVQ